MQTHLVISFVISLYYYTVWLAHSRTLTTLIMPRYSASAPAFYLDMFLLGRNL
ncbi:hypothetical protein PSPO01_01596 [Paraphaeosphaeria sporulosa]